MRSSFLLLLVCLLAPLASARQIHSFRLFCDAYPGEAGNINESVAADRLMVSSFFANNIREQAWGVTQRTIDLYGANANLEQFRRRWAEFSQGIGADDTVYVHFSGHGVIPDRETGEQVLQLCDENAISRLEWAKLIKALPCRLKIFVTDCCSSYMDHDLAEGDEEVYPWNTVHTLLLRHEGFVDITAASPGQPAYGTQTGGYLTINLLSDMARFRTWKEVFFHTQARVYEECVRDIRANGPADKLPQRPYAYSLGKPRIAGGGHAGLATTPDPEVSGFVLPDSNTREFTAAQLQSLGLLQLYLARNEIFARHGYDFSTPMLQRYFAAQPWYQRRPGMKNPELSRIESRNSDLILQVEKSKGGPFIAGKIQLPDQGGSKPAPDVFAYSSKQMIPRPALERLTLPQLSIARNEIYARHGYPFRSKTLQQFFARKPGYRRNPAATDPDFNAVEKQNLWLIKKLERIKGGPHSW